jgi:hypothetical protein
MVALPVAQLAKFLAADAARTLIEGEQHADANVDCDAAHDVSVLAISN